NVLNCELGSRLQTELSGNHPNANNQNLIDHSAGMLSERTRLLLDALILTSAGSTPQASEAAVLLAGRLNHNSILARRTADVVFARCNSVLATTELSYMQRQYLLSLINYSACGCTDAPGYNYVHA